jgi:hypothetical protein
MSNGSDHIPVTAVLAAGELEKKSNTKPERGLVLGKPKWDESDHLLYQELVAGRLSKSAANNAISVSSIDIELLVSEITTTLAEASDHTIPRPQFTHNFTRKFPADVLQTYKKSKEVYWQWKLEGKNPNDPLRDELKLLKKKLRA